MKKLILLSLFMLMACDNKSHEKIQKQEARTEEVIPTVSLIEKGTNCKPSPDKQGMVCVYQIGNDLTFAIWGIGTKNSTVIIGKSIGEDGEYTVQFERNSPCLTITAWRKTLQRAKAQFGNEYFAWLLRNREAYISLANGLPYRFREECELFSRRSGR